MTKSKILIIIAIVIVSGIAVKFLVYDSFEKGTRKTEKTASFNTETSADGLVRVDKEDNSVNSATKLPGAPPKETLVYPNSEIIVASSSLVKDQDVIAFQTNDSLEEVKEYYVKELAKNNWKPKFDLWVETIHKQLNEHHTSNEYKKNEQLLLVSLSSYPDKGEVVIILSYK